jgi:hypothetical protein
MDLKGDWLWRGEMELTHIHVSGGPGIYGFEFLYFTSNELASAVCLPVKSLKIILEDKINLCQ